MPKQNQLALLRSIQSDEMETVYEQISRKAVEWAVAGFIQPANELLETLWNYNIPHSRNLKQEDNGLQIIWSIYVQQPSHIPFELSNPSAIVEKNWVRALQPNWAPSFTNKFVSYSIKDLKGVELFAKSLIAFHEESEDIATILHSIKRYLENDLPVGYQYAQATSCGSLIACKSGDEVLSEYFIEKWAKGYLEFPQNYSLSHLMCEPTMAKYLSTGIVGKIWNFDMDEILEELIEIKEALAKRIANGKSLVFGNLSWKELLDRINSQVFQLNDYQFPEIVLLNKSLATQAAPAEDIEEAEERLGVKLPEDYKEFLRTSNGFYEFSNISVRIAPVAEIDFLENVNEQMVEIWGDAYEQTDPILAQKFKKSIIIGGHYDEQQLLLVTLPNHQWECWHFANWRPGEEVFDSFRAYMEYELRDLESK